MFSRSLIFLHPHGNKFWSEFQIKSKRSRFICSQTPEGDRIRCETQDRFGEAHLPLPQWNLNGHDHRLPRLRSPETASTALETSLLTAKARNQDRSEPINRPWFWTVVCRVGKGKLGHLGTGGRDTHRAAGPASLPMVGLKRTNQNQNPVNKTNIAFNNELRLRRLTYLSRPG